MWNIGKNKIFYLDHTIRYQLILFVSFHWNWNTSKYFFRRRIAHYLSPTIPNNFCAHWFLYLLSAWVLYGPHLSRSESCWPSVKCAQVIVSNWLAAARPTRILLSGISPTERCVNIFVFFTIPSAENQPFETIQRELIHSNVIKRNNARIDWPQVLC